MNLEDVIKEKVEAFDFEGAIEESVRDCVEKIVTARFSDTIKSHIHSYTSGIIQAECEAILNGPVEIYDGWDKKESFDSFELLFKARLKSALSGRNWDIKRHVDNLVAEKMSALTKEAKNEIAIAVAEKTIAKAASLATD